MGIPSYFSYIIKNHSNIIRNRRRLKVKFSSLYMDCNSIIYDCVRKVENDTEPRPKGFDFEDTVIRNVITKIEKYVADIQPTDVLYIAFDGVAPFAKMEQQRIRRYKTGYLSAVAKGDVPSTKQTICNENAVWNTSAITPGTQFMNTLSLKVKRAFVDSGKYFGVKTLIVSGSDEPGEGEHKMFQYMRSNAMKIETIAVYGLDADLIMLSLFHCFACENIYIFRESPEFGRAALEDSFDRDELLYLDSRSLSDAILNEMGIVESANDSRCRIYDYIFACFLLGNDFMPHFPALNIRTHGNYTILETYRKLFARYPDRRFISLESGNIQWKWVKLFLQHLANDEHRLILNEYESRHKMEKRFYPTNTQEERINAFENIPTIYRSEENYVHPGESGWETRYYDVAFHLEGTPQSNSNKTAFLDSVCNNYLEGLEWTFKYYTEGCPHWRWKYNYHYPPLLVDLVKRIPNFETTYIDETAGINRPFLPNTQLAYVIPPWNHNLLRDSGALLLEEKYYVDIDNLRFQWMFCKFFWESHAILPEIPLSELEKLDENSNKKQNKSK